MRMWRKISVAREVIVAKREGVEEMRSTVIEHFNRYDRCEFTGRAVVAILRNLGVD